MDVACEIDSYTKRPRTPNDPYTIMTDEQISNITRVCNERSTLFICSVLFWPQIIIAL